jgi:3-hydroxypropanoate dehydrogenase
MGVISGESAAQIFTEARTFSAWQPKGVEDRLLHDIYELLKWGPTSANCCPARFVFVKSPGEKEKLVSCLDKGNVAKVQAAPVTVIIAQDEKFYDYLPKLAPHSPAMKDTFAKDPALAQSTAFRNSTLQGAYFIITARAFGLDCGPMSGFNNKKVDEFFFAGTSWKSNFICSIGYGDKSKLHPRAPRLSFDEACKVV